MFDKLAILNVSRRCNHACVYCSEGDVHSGELVPLSVVRETLERLRERGYDSVNFMGAETTLRSDLPELLDLVHEHGLEVALTSNGVRFADRRFAEAVLPRLDALELSLPSDDAQIYRQITGRSHLPHLQRALGHLADIVRRLERPRFVTFNVVVCRLNPSAPAGVARLLGRAELGPRVLLHAIRARREGRGSERDDLSLDFAACAAAFREGVGAARELGLKAMYRGLPLCSLLDEVGHNFSALEWVAHPNNTYLNAKPLHEGASIDDKVGLDRIGRRYPAKCGGCSLRAMCPGVDSDVPSPEAEIATPVPSLDPRLVLARLRAGPLGTMLSDVPRRT